MKVKILLLFAFVIATSDAFSQQKASWENWSWLIGEWAGEGSGQPGDGGGTFSFSLDLDENIMVRKSHSEYPAANGNPKTIHNDLMVVSADFNGVPSKAIYFDNEGHTINYKISYAKKSIILQSEKMQNVPIFRLTYSLLDDKMVNTKFEMSQDGENFMTYIEGKSKKIK